MLIYTNQTIAAKYLYDPYGNALSMSGPLANLNVYRFSSKEWNGCAMLYYYLYRFFDPNLQRWLNRDLIQEAGWINLYEFAGNDPIGRVDYFGEEPTLGGPWGMFGYGIFGRPFTTPPVSSAFVEQARNSAQSYERDLIYNLRSELKCGQSGASSISQTFGTIGIGSPNTGSWQLSLTGNCHWTCEKATPPDCCCNCQVTCDFSGYFSKTWTFQPWGFNPKNRQIPFEIVWGATLEIQYLLYGTPGGMYFMSGEFKDSQSIPIHKVCNN